MRGFVGTGRRRLDHQSLSRRALAQEANRSGFTLLELLIATAVLAVILVLTLSMIDGVGTLAKQTRSKIEAFQEARSAFEAMTRNVSQAILNTYWDYDDPNSPTDYLRESELHFIAGPAQSGGGSNLLAETNLDTHGHSVFFQAATGISRVASGIPLDSLVNAVGYYLVFGSDADLRPPFLEAVNVPLRYRFRLMAMTQPSEDLTVYSDFKTFKATNDDAVLDDWFIAPLSRAVPSDPADSSGPPVHVIAENIIALVIEPMRSPNDPLAPSTTLAPGYFYDSRAFLRGGGAAADLTRNQLPPLLRITMVTLSEESANRLQGSSTSQPTIPVSGGKAFNSLFQDPANYQSDLSDLEKGLSDAHLGYRVFTTTLSILQAKWSE